LNAHANSWPEREAERELYQLPFFLKLSLYQSEGEIVSSLLPLSSWFCGQCLAVSTACYLCSRANCAGGMGQKLETTPETRRRKRPLICRLDSFSWQHTVSGSNCGQRSGPHDNQPSRQTRQPLALADVDVFFPFGRKWTTKKGRPSGLFVGCSFPQFCLLFGHCQGPVAHQH